MKIKILLSSFIILFFAGKGFPQYMPENFNLGVNKSLAKTTSVNPIVNNSINDIVTVGDTIWLATGQGLSLSTDGGSDWKNFTGGATFGSEGISAIAYNKRDGTFWAATVHSMIQDNQTLPVGSGLKYTSDNGQTWTSLPQPVDAESDSVVVYGIDTLKALPITVTPQNVVWDIAFTPGTIWIASYSAGIRKSTDMGKTWQRVILPPDFLDSVSPKDTLDFCVTPQSGNFCNQNNYNYRGFSIIAINDSTLYAGTAGGINKSTDGGISWVKFNHNNELNPISGNFIVALAYNKADSTIWGATWQAAGSSEYYAVSYSSDGGANWKTTLRGEHVHNFGIQGKEVIALSDDGPFATLDNGNTWVLPNKITDRTSNLSINSAAFYAAAFTGNNIWLGSDDGLAEFTNNGNGIWSGTWNLYFASKELSSVSDTYAYPNPFDPTTDVLKIKYSTMGKTVPVTIRILDFGMHIVRTVIQNADRGNPSHVIDPKGDVVDYWDGRDEAGNMVPNGVYFYRVDAGSEKPVFGKILVLH